MQQAILTDALGYAAAGLVFATFCAKRMASLRALAIVSMADPGPAQRNVADEHPALSAIVARTVLQENNRRENAGAEWIDAPAQLDNCLARSAALREPASDSDTNLQCSLATFEARKKVTFPKSPCTS